MSLRRPSLLFVNQHYWPDVASTGQHLTDLCEYLAAQGFDVSVLTSRANYTAGAVAAPAAETRNGARIRRLRGTRFGRGSHLGRIADYASFYVAVLRALLTGPRHDGTVFLTTPPLIAFAGWIALRLRGRRYAIWSMDLHPEAELGAGMLRAGSPVALFLDWASDRAHRNADLVVDLGAYMKRRLLARGVREARTRTVPVWSAGDEIEPIPRDRNPLVAELGLTDRFVVMYSGNAGLVHDFAPLLEAMRRLREHPRIYFLFVGDGPRRAEIERFAAGHALPNFAYRPYFRREQIRHSLTVADVHVATLSAPFVGVAVPGKVYGIMAAGRPALFVGPARCESADAIRDAGCGAVVDPASATDAPAQIVTALTQWCASPEEVAAMGARGRSAFLARYERDANCAAFARLLSATWGGDSGARELHDR